MKTLDVNARFLVVDDSTTMLRIIKNTIQRLGYNNIITALDGEEGLVEFLNETPDIICTDWNMPNMNGLDFIIAVRQVNKQIPILMITTEGGKTEVITALKAGATNYIVKPFTPQILKEKLEVILGLNI